MSPGNVPKPPPSRAFHFGDLARTDQGYLGVVVRREWNDACTVFLGNGLVTDVQSSALRPVSFQADAGEGDGATTTANFAEILRPWRGCGGAKFFKVGLTLGQVDRLVEESRRFYRADGTSELLSAEVVTKRRIEAARDIERMRRALVEIRDTARLEIDLPGSCVREVLEQIEADARAALEGR